MVSRRHAVISFRNGRYYLKDLGSSNGTLVNEVRVALDDEVEVGHGTVVQVMGKKENIASSLTNKTMNENFRWGRLASLVISTQAGKPAFSVNQG